MLRGVSSVVFMTDSETSVDPVVLPHSRRWLLRGGAVAAATAGVAAVAAAVPTPAQAADGDLVELGAENRSETATTITLGDDQTGGPDATLALENAGGPSLFLQPLSYESAPELGLGQFANTELGPVAGVETLAGLTTTFLVTGVDLADLPTPYALAAPVRLLDTRSAASRATVLRSSTTPATADVFDATGRLRANGWIDVEIAAEEVGVDIPAAYLNATAVSPVGPGFLTVYPPGDRPGTSTLVFQKSVSIANQAFVATRIVFGRYAARIFTKQATHVTVDLTGVTIKGTSPTPAAADQADQQRSPDTGANTRATDQKRAASLASRLRSSLAERVARSLSSR